MNIENLDRIATNDRRRRILETIPPIFEKLDPENRCSIAGEEISKSLPPGSKVYVMGFGKASMKMYNGIRRPLKERIASSWIIVPSDFNGNPEFKELKILKGTHPITGKETEQSTNEILERMKELSEGDTVIVLISGGGSALFEAPVDGVGIKQIAEASKCLMNEDADIYELNIFRRFYSKVKGGRLADSLYPARVIGLVVSDVFGDDLGTIASGPLTTWKPDVLELDRLVEKYGKACPILSDLRGKADAREVNEERFKKVEQRIILRNRDFVDEFINVFREWGEEYVSLGTDINGDVGKVAMFLSEAVSKLGKIKSRGFWFAFGGETTVEVHGNGRGGRNLELSLRFLRQMEDEDFLFISAGTDGVDGKSPAMGGIVDTHLREKIDNDEIDKYLHENNSFALMERENSAIITGRTGTNVSDIMVGYFHPHLAALSSGQRNKGERS